MRRQYYEEEKRREEQEILRKIRFADRNNVEELILPILSNDLVHQFHNQAGEQLANTFRPVPNCFASGEEYLNVWMPLFLYETYNQLISQKNTSKDEIGSKINKNRQYNFTCKIVQESKDINYVYLNLFDNERPTGQEDQKGVRKWKETLDKIRDYDLLLISMNPIDTAQNWCNADLFQ